MSKNITLTLIHDFPFIFKNCTDHPLFDDPSLYINYFQQRMGSKFITFPFPDPFFLTLLNKYKDKIYNSFYAFRPDGQSNLITYFQFDAENHASACYVVNKNTDKQGILLNFYVKDHDFVLKFAEENKEFLESEEKIVGFGGAIK